MREIRQEFRPNEDSTDMSILYEITGYQVENASETFWDQYKDFEELGQNKLVKTDKNEVLMATRRTSKRQRIAIEEGQDID